MEKRSEFEKNLKTGKWLLVVGAFLLCSALVTCGSSLFLGKEKEPISLADAKEGDYSYVDVKIMSDYFATNDYTKKEHKTYFIWDEKYIYIADISDNNREKLNEIYDYSYNSNDKEKMPESVRISGIAKRIPSDMRKITISQYNKMFGSEKLTSSNFQDYLGKVYLDTYEIPMDESLMSFMAAIPLLIATLILFIIFYSKRRRTKKNITRLGDEWESILQEIDSSDCLHYKKAKVYLTRNYLISYQNGLEVFNYDNIVWVYPHEYRYNGRVSQKSIFVVLKNSKARKLATVSASKKNLIMFDEMYESFLNRVPNVLSGYTKENKEKAKELYEK